MSETQQQVANRALETLKTLMDLTAERRTVKNELARLDRELAFAQEAYYAAELAWKKALLK